jgi:hypothetical protein
MVFDQNAKRLADVGGIPKVPSGWRMQNTEADLPFTSMSWRSSRSTVGATSPVCARTRDATPAAILPARKPRRDSMKVSDAG